MTGWSVDTLALINQIVRAGDAVIVQLQPVVNLGATMKKVNHIIRESFVMRFVSVVQCFQNRMTCRKSILLDTSKEIYQLLLIASYVLAS